MRTVASGTLPRVDPFANLRRVGEGLTRGNESPRRPDLDARIAIVGGNMQSKLAL